MKSRAYPWVFVALQYALFAAWLHYGQEWAGNILFFYVWLVSVLAFLVALSDKDVANRRKPQPLLRVAAIGLVVIWVAAGYFFTALAFLFAVMVSWAKNDMALKKAQESEGVTP